LIGFDGEIARRWLQHRFISKNHPVLKINAEDTVLATFSRVMQVHESNRPGAPTNSCRRNRQPAGPVLFRSTGAACRPTQNSNAIELAIARIQNAYARDLKQ